MADRTPLYPEHLRLGARLVEFAGYEMPVSYSGIIAEHNAVRAAAGLFDISHMGLIKISGEKALAFIQKLTTNDASKLKIGQAQYAMLCQEDGGVIDDILVYSFADHYLFCVNASNVQADFDWAQKNNAEGATLEFWRGKKALLSFQGPKVLTLLQNKCALDLAQIPYYHAVIGKVAGIESYISRTGYTGEDGFELFFDLQYAVQLWQELLSLGALPCGLGARDSLRLEAAMPLYGHEHSRQTTPLETGVGWAVKFDKGAFIGREALFQEKERGLKRKLVGVQLDGRAIPRQGYRVKCGDNFCGEITSGTLSPTLNVPIGMAYLAPPAAEVGRPIAVEIRGNLFPGKIVPLPFYKRRKT